jgi:LacI family transcriptional regulator
LHEDVADQSLEAFQFMPNTTLDALAKACGVSRASASRALSGHPNVSKAMRERVTAMAEERGYHRNHLVSTIMGRVRGGRTQHFLGNIAFVHIASARQTELNPMQRQIVNAAQACAHAMGYNLSFFTLGYNRGAPNPKALARILLARGILGVIFLQPDWNNATAGFPWEKFATIQIDYDSTKIAHHTISLDHYFTLIGALDRIKSLGYKKLGLFIEHYKDARIGYKWTSAFRSFQENQGGIGAMPVLRAETITKTHFLNWYQTHRPDLIVGHMDQALIWLQESGLKSPEHIGFFNLNWNERTLPCAGLDLKPEQFSVVAVETLAAQIHRNERGLPLDPRTVMISGRWVDGPTLLNI